MKQHRVSIGVRDDSQRVPKLLWKFSTIFAFSFLFKSLVTLWTLSTEWFSVAKMKKKFVGGCELDIVLLIAALALAAIGGGAFSVDCLPSL